MKVPSLLADGEADWAYTGMVEIDGVRLALLENATTHQGGYVRVGESWKKSRIVSVTMACLVVEGPDGKQTSVFRFNANKIEKPKPPPEGGFKPLDPSPALKGPIGLEIKREEKPAAAVPLGAVKKEINP